MPALRPVTVATPDAVSTVRVRVHRSWKGRAFAIANAVLSFALALLGYLGTVNLANFGLTADRALFWASIIGLAQFVLLQVNPFRIAETSVEPGADPR